MSSSVKHFKHLWRHLRKWRVFFHTSYVISKRKIYRKLLPKNHNVIFGKKVEKFTWRWTAWATLSRLLTQGCRRALLAVIRFVGSNSSIESISCFTSRDTKIFITPKSQIKQPLDCKSLETDLYPTRVRENCIHRALSIHITVLHLHSYENFSEIFRLKNQPTKRVGNQQVKCKEWRQWPKRRPLFHTFLFESLRARGSPEFRQNRETRFYRFEFLQPDQNRLILSPHQISSTRGVNFPASNLKGVFVRNIFIFKKNYFHDHVLKSDQSKNSPLWIMLFLWQKLTASRICWMHLEASLSE